MRSAGFTCLEVGSISVVQIVTKLFEASLFLRIRMTGFSGHGNLSDSWKVPHFSEASGIVCHSPNTLANPLE